MINKRILTRLLALRRSLAAADGERDGSFSAVFHAFLDLTEDPAFIQGSKATKDPVVKAALESLAMQLSGDDSAPLQHVRMLRIAEAGMVHGGFFIGSMMGSFFFFEKEEQGLLAVHRGGGMMLYSRLTMAKVPPGAVPVPGPKGPQ